MAGAPGVSEFIEAEFQDDGPASPINIALVIQNVINAARAWRDTRRPIQAGRLIAALGELDDVEELL